MRIAVTGASGLVGRAFCQHAAGLGHEVLKITRSNPGPGQLAWNPQEGTIDKEGLEGVDAVVHLAGENIAHGRWTEAKKARIRDSRVQGTTVVAQALRQLERKPRVFVSASAVGYYGDRGDEELTEKSSPGTGFLADVCRFWEAAADGVADTGIRVVKPRISVVLSKEGGALKQMLLPFKLGVGGRLGSGTQHFSWIDLDDLVRVLWHAVIEEKCQGALNATAPNPVTNAEYTKTLGRLLQRPTLLPVPAFAARLALGEMAEELLLVSFKAVPQRLREQGFVFQYPTLEESLRHQLGL